MIHANTLAQAQARDRVPAPPPEPYHAPPPLLTERACDMLATLLAGMATVPVPEPVRVMNSPKRGFRPIGQKPPEQIAPGTKREPPNYRFINGERVRLRNFKRFGAA